MAMEGVAIRGFMIMLALINFGSQPSAAAKVVANRRLFSFGVTGDFNLFTDPKSGIAGVNEPEDVWGDLLTTLRGLADICIMRNGEVTWIGQANNHQFDFWGEGVNHTISTLQKHRLLYGGLGSFEEVRKPVLIPIPGNNSGINRRLAVFSLVAQTCHRRENGSAIMTSCTCGLPSSMSGLPPRQCYAANATAPGLWYFDFPVGETAVTEIADAPDEQHNTSPSGPNFEWNPSGERETFMRALAARSSVDMIWGTSSHHIQRMEEHAGVPIIYGVGDLLFRFIPGVTFPTACEQGQSPCEQFRPEISVVYEFILSDALDDDCAGPSKKKNKNGGEGRKGLPRQQQRRRPKLEAIRAHITSHDNFTVNHASADDKHWAMTIFNELPLYSMNLCVLRIVVARPGISYGGRAVGWIDLGASPR
eukprot:jgi/Bigna1/86763/estExt_fgenesh1_pg.C_130202